jgi:hypothetical protein
VALRVLHRWRCLRLWWRVEWPLSLVVTDEAMRRYNEVFSFLLSVRVVQAQLQVRARARLKQPETTRSN